MADAIRQTKSVCPVCLARIDAAYVQGDDGVRLEKNCPQHGVFSAPVWDTAEDFEAWLQDSPPQKPHNPAKKRDKGCPYDCGLCQDHQQASCCVLLEVTARCDLGCPVCYADAGQDTGDDPTLAQIEGWYDMLLQRGGPFNIQLSGGEPTMRDDLPGIIAAGKARGFTFFQLNTNGLRLAHDTAYLAALVKAGLSTVFLQFDALRDEPYVQLRGRPLAALKQQAVNNCAAAGVAVVLVPTVKQGCNLQDVGAIVDYAATNMPVVRGVHFQPISFFGRYDAKQEDGRVTVPLLLDALEQQTRGRVKRVDFAPGSAEHALCTFHADYVVGPSGWQPQKTAGCCAINPNPSSDRARNAVAEKWAAPALPSFGWEDKTGYDLGSLDAFLVQRKTQTLALSGMAFQDSWSLDLQRLCRCHVHVVSQKGTLVPFCAYNLTNTQGTPHHRQKGTV